MLIDEKTKQHEMISSKLFLLISSCCLCFWYSQTIADGIRIVID